MTLSPGLSASHHDSAVRGGPATSPYVLVLHRWVHGQAEYHLYPRPRGHDLVFVAATNAVHRVPPDARMVRTVRTMDDTERVLDVVEEIVGRRGRPWRVVALDEADLLTAARARSAHDVLGDGVERTLLFCDKLRMLDRVRAAGAVPVPDFAAVAGAQDVHDFASRTGYPVVVRPRLGTASRGFSVVEGPGDLVHLDEPSVVQRLCEAQIAHVDGWWDGHELGEWQPSFYVNTCPAFGLGTALGSFEITDPGTRERIRAATVAVCEALCSGDPLVFHLELFVADGSISFLEIGSRVGGAEVPFVWREVHGLDLLEVAWSVQLGLGVDVDRARRTPTATGDTCPDGTAGWLVTDGRWHDEPPPGAYWAEYAASRPVGVGTFEGAAVRMRFSGPSGSAVAASVHEAIRRIEAASRA